MKISNEVKVGTVALLTIACFIWLYSFLKGNDLISSTDTYYIIYDNISGLTESNPVEINGYHAGVVQDISLINDGSGKLGVSISVDKHFNIPRDTKAEITTATLIAGMKIVLHMGRSPEMCQNHDTLSGYVATSIIERLSESLSPLEGSLKDIVFKLDSVISGLNSILTPQMTRDFRQTVSSVSEITSDLSEVTGKEKEKLASAIEDLKTFTAMLSANSASLDSTLKNLRTVTDTIASADLSGILTSLKSSLVSVDELMKGLSNGEGSAGRLMKDDSLYTNLNNTLFNLDLLLKDMRENPKRYVHFSVFGKSDK